jgi:NAD(P)-dependent dehydrogenase (short-subunit alcohol dehydrogenase family)
MVWKLMTTVIEAAAAATAEVVALLASPRARYIAGTTVAADGGRTAV